MSEYYGGGAANEIFRDYSPGPRSGVDPDPQNKVAPDQIDKKAKATLILGLLSLVLGFVTGLPALWVGRKSLRHIAASGGELRGRRLAITGMSLGCVGILLTSVAWLYLHDHPGLHSPVDVAKKVGCTDVQREPQLQSRGFSSVTCSFQGDSIVVSWFDSRAQENAFKDATTKLVGLPVTVYGDRWAISCNGAATCAAAEKAMS
ncbi:MAG: DUF4190 domain-containing protein [Nocardioides sp.]